MFWRKKKEEKEIIEGLAWFHYSVILPELEDEERDVTIIGNLFIKNTGNIALNSPLICIRIKPAQFVRLGGKIGSLNHTALTIDGTNAESWRYIHDDWKKKVQETGEHWLTPNHCTQLAAGETLSFATEIIIPGNADNSTATVEGYFYCNEMKDGIATLNTITMNM